MLNYLLLGLTINSILFATSITETKTSFRDYKLVGLNVSNIEHLSFINEWAENHDFTLWSKLYRNFSKEIDVILSPQSYFFYRNLFEKHEIDYRIKYQNVQELFDKEVSNKTRLFSSLRQSLVTQRYLSYDEIYHFMNQLSYYNPSYVSMYSAGKTYENRDIVVLKLKTPTSKRSVWMDCGIHAREWISISTCVYMMNKFVEDYNKRDPITLQLLSYYEIHIMPMVNPDGYQYSIKSNRMWRKNRNPNDKKGCYGVDLNRNFGYYWLTSGSSQNECADTFAGISADSELEVRAVQNAIMSKYGQWDSYLTFHSYGQYFFTPWGFTSNLPNDYRDLYIKAQIAVNAIHLVSGSEFTVGSSANLLYSSSGGSEDWAKGRAGVKYSYCVELRPKVGNSLNEFIVPESQIEQSGEEIYQGVRALYESIRTSF